MPVGRGPRPTANFFTTLLWRVNVEITFTNTSFVYATRNGSFMRNKIK